MPDPSCKDGKRMLCASVCICANNRSKALNVAKNFLAFPRGRGVLVFRHFVAIWLSDRKACENCNSSIHLAGYGWHKDCQVFLQRTSRTGLQFLFVLHWFDYPGRLRLWHPGGKHKHLTSKQCWAQTLRSSWRVLQQQHQQQQQQRRWRRRRWPPPPPPPPPPTPPPTPPPPPQQSQQPQQPQRQQQRSRSRSRPRPRRRRRRRWPQPCPRWLRRRLQWLVFSAYCNTLQQIPALLKPQTWQQMLGHRALQVSWGSAQWQHRSPIGPRSTSTWRAKYLIDFLYFSWRILQDSTWGLITSCWNMVWDVLTLKDSLGTCSKLLSQDRSLHLGTAYCTSPRKKHLYQLDLNWLQMINCSKSWIDWVKHVNATRDWH